MTKEERTARKEQKRAEKRQIMAEWKAERKEAKALKKRRKKARPFYRKLLAFLWRLALVLLCLTVVFFAVGGVDLAEMFIDSFVMDIYFTAGYAEPDIEAERAMIPADEAAQAAIRNMSGYGEDDTWAIYVYLIGSNLESSGQNDLSSMVDLQTSLARKEIEADVASTRRAGLLLYMDTIAEAGLELPGPMYYPEPPVSAGTYYMTEDIIVAEYPGAVSMDVDEMLAVELPEGIEIVMQTGGATHWTNSMINPNRVQRFCYSSEGFVEESNKPTYSMSTPEALADFLQYCEENHPADHKVLVLWDHGGGAFGYGHDELYDQMMSLQDIGEALGSVYTANPRKPAFELIGFDACLMASAEVLHTLDGYGRYFAGSEETEPGFGWFYTGWLQELADDRSMNGAQLGLAIADSYMDFYARLNNNTLQIPLAQGLTFSVLDLHKAAQVYDAYEAMLNGMMKDAAQNQTIISDLSSAARSAIHYSGSAYNIYNTVDLGTLVDHLPPAYGKAAQAVRDCLDDAVLYVRSDDALAGSQGLSVYFPDEVLSASSVLYLMDYVENITDSEIIRALYFYKSTGCLTEDMQEALKEAGITPLKTLDLSALQAVSAEPITFGEGSSFSLKVSPEAKALMQDPKLSICRVDDKAGTFTYYGEDKLVNLGGDGTLTASFDNCWITMNGQPLFVRTIEHTEDHIQYASPIRINGENATMVIRYDREKQEFAVLGAYLDEDALDGDYLGRNVSDLTPGVKITPLYETTSYDSTVIVMTEGNSFRYTKDTTLTVNRKPLADGDYLMLVDFSSIRGDEFSSGIVELKLNGGKTESIAVSEDFAVVLYQ